MTNKYYLKNRGLESEVTDASIRELFEKRMEDMGWQSNYERALSGDYTDSHLQTKWEDFYNGFRLGEDAI